MRAAALRAGDVVEADIRGRRFEARVKAIDDREIPGHPILVEPLAPNVSYRRLRSRQVRKRIGGSR